MMFFMMRYISTILFVTIGPLAAIATPNYKQVAQLLYPNNTADQAFMLKLFEILEMHKTQDPLMGGKGPSVAAFGMDKQPLAFIINERDAKVDLVIINWELPVFTGLEEFPAMSTAINNTAYILRDLDKKTIATQGENNDKLSNFSYIKGTNVVEKQLRAGQPDYVIPNELLNWKPHPDYMEPNHPLRMALDGLSLILLSPDKNKLFGHFANDPANIELIEAKIISQGGYLNTVLGMMVHETFHVRERNDMILHNVALRNIYIDREALVEKLHKDDELKKLLAAYANTVFMLGDSLKSNHLEQERSLLADLQLLITELKTKYPNVWAFIWEYEYSEGFAEYVSAQSMIATKVTNFSQQIDLQKEDSSNNFVYRTGALGGLHLYYRLRKLPFDNNEDHTMSVWEIILSQTEVPTSQNTISDIMSRNSSSNLNLDHEVELVIEYLVSTVADL